MVRVASGPAKLSRPRLHAPVLRPRLHERLDALRQHPAIWIAGPPGAGKTTLVASYLDQRKLPAVWCQFDAGDTDPASFFYYLGLAAKRGTRTRRRNDLPLLGPEYLGDLPGFARRFFRALFAQMAGPAVLVLDNVQEVTSAPMIESVLAEAIAEVPEGINVVFISRTKPPEAFGRVLANRDMALLDWDEIRLTLEETRLLVDAVQPLDDLTLSRLHARSAGWVAGVILLLERLRRGGRVDFEGEAEPPQQLFDYFALQILAQASPEDQHILLHLGFLPRMTAPLAEALAGTSNAPRLLDRLYRGHLFIDRRQGGFPSDAAGPARWTYEFHALFRTFLRHQAAETYSTGKVAEIATRAADLLDANGATEDAVQLYLEAGAYASAERVLMREAQQFVAMGRGQVVASWTARLPPDRLAADPWLLYWSGAARLATEPAIARLSLERAYDLALAAGDEMCQLRSAAEVVETYFQEYSHFTPLDRWIPVLQRALESGPAFDTRESEMRVWLALLDALMVRPIAQEMLPIAIERVFTLFSQVREVNLQASAARTLLLCNTHIGRFEVARHAALLVQPLLKHPDVLPITRAMTLFALSWYSVCVRQYEEGMAFVGQMEALARDQGMPFLVRLGHYMAGLLELFRGDIDRARERAALMEQTMFPNHPYDMASNLALKAWIEVAARQPTAVLALIPRAIELFDQVGSSLQRQGQMHPLHWAYAEMGDRAATRRAVEEQRVVADEVGYHDIGWLLGECSLAYVALRDNDLEDGHAHLADALRHCREHNLGYLLQFIRSWMPELCAEALGAGIEADFVRHLVREYQWLPPAPDAGEWPWQIRIRTLGAFEVELDGQRIEFARKAPRKVLSLLKALVAHGGREVPLQKLIDALWKDDEADKAQEALTMAVRRLRLLLRDPDAIIQSGGALSIDARRCWVDAWAFERLTDTGNAGKRDNDAKAHGLYRGGFLQQDLDAPWAIAMRERLRTRFVGLIERRGAGLEQQGDHAAAIECYQHGLEADDLIELFYQRLMRCHLAMGRRAEGLGVFRRMRQTLSVTLGIKPSAESEALYRQLSAVD